MCRVFVFCFFFPFCCLSLAFLQIFNEFTAFSDKPKLVMQWCCVGAACSRYLTLKAPKKWKCNLIIGNSRPVYFICAFCRWNKIQKRKTTTTTTTTSMTMKMGLSQMNWDPLMASIHIQDVSLLTLVSKQKRGIEQFSELKPCIWFTLKRLQQMSNLGSILENVICLCVVCVCVHKPRCTSF